MKLGAWGTIVGSAITRPSLITSWYVESIKKQLDNKTDRHSVNS